MGFPILSSLRLQVSQGFFFFILSSPFLQTEKTALPGNPQLSGKLKPTCLKKVRDCD